MDKLIHGDCFVELPKIATGSVDLVCSDPPYIIGTRGGGGVPGAEKYLKKIAAKRLHEGFDLALLNEFLRVLKVPNIIVFCSKAQLREYMNWADRLALRWALISWHKTNPVPFTNNSYLPDTEYIFHFWRGKQLGGCYRTKRRLYVQPKMEGRGDYPHPTVKPLNIVLNLIENASEAGDVVLDPFLGSGTTAVAAKVLGRRFIGIEHNGKYVELARKRIEETSFGIVPSRGLSRRGRRRKRPRRGVLARLSSVYKRILIGGTR